MLSYWMDTPAMRTKDTSATWKHWKFPWEKGESPSIGFNSRTLISNIALDAGCAGGGHRDAAF